jgi:TolB-like protein
MTWHNDRAPPSRPGEPVVAVLPLVPYGNDAAAGILGEKLTEGITAELVRDARLAVVPSARVARFRDPYAIPDDIGAQLGAQFLLRGRVVPEAEGSLRVEVVLMDGALTRKPWGSSFTGSTANLDELEHRIAQEVAAAIAGVAQLSPPESSSAR